MQHHRLLSVTHLILIMVFPFSLSFAPDRNPVEKQANVAEQTGTIPPSQVEEMTAAKPASDSINRGKAVFGPLATISVPPATHGLLVMEQPLVVLPAAGKSSNSPAALPQGITPPALSIEPPALPSQVIRQSEPLVAKRLDVTANRTIAPAALAPAAAMSPYLSTQPRSASAPSLDWSTQPDLYPGYIEAWNGPWLLSNTTGAKTYTSNNLAANLPTYANWCVINNGASTSVTFHVYIKLDGNTIYGHSMSGLPSGWEECAVDQKLFDSVAPGQHTLELAIDPENLTNDRLPGNNNNDDYYSYSTLLPDLAPVVPVGWDGTIVAANTPGTHTSTLLFSDQDIYVDWAVQNTGLATSQSFQVCLWLDTTMYDCWPVDPPFAMNSTGSIDDFVIPAGDVEPGSHTLKVVYDPQAVIQESNETNNTATRGYTWNQPYSPDLAAYIPDGWDGAIVASNVQGTHTSTVLYANQPTYVDWAMINNGHDIASSFSSCLYLDDVQQQCWPSNGLLYHQVGSTQDYVIPSGLAPGSHTIKLVIDVNNAIAETDESNNWSTRSTSWIGTDCYTMTLTPSPAGSGTISTSPGPNCNGTQYYAGSKVRLTANPASGYVFSSWGGQISSATNPIDVVINGNGTVIANFNAVATCYTLSTSVSPGGSGTVSASPGPNCSGSQYAAGTQVTLTASPSGGYQFSTWGGDAGGSTNPVTVTMSANRSVTANFTVPAACYTLSLAVSPSGSGSADASPAPNCEGGKYTAGTQITLTASAGTGYMFGTWAGVPQVYDNPTTFAITHDTLATALFNPQAVTCYSLNLSAPSGGGSISANPAPNCNGSQYTSGTSVQLTPAANSGYKFDTWGGDVTGATVPATVTMVSDRNVMAIFTALTNNCFYLSVTQTTHVKVAVSPAPNCGAEYSAGTQVTLTATVDSGYSVDWIEGSPGAPQPADHNANPLILTMDRDHQIYARAGLICYMLDVKIAYIDIHAQNPGGVIKTPPNCGNAWYIPGTVVELTAVPNPGFSFSAWSGAVNSTDATISITVNADQTETVNFKQVCFALNVMANPANQISSFTINPPPDCVPGKYYYPTTNVTITANLIYGYGVDYWSGTGVSIVRGNSLTVLMDINRQISAVMGACYTVSVYASGDPTYGSKVAITSPPTPSCIGGQYVGNNPITITPTGGYDYEFSNWSGDATGTAKPLNVTVNKNMVIAGNFVKAQCYAMTVFAPYGLGFTISPPYNCNNGYKYGTVVQITAADYSYYQFSHWEGERTGTDKTVTFTMDTHHSVTAVFVDTRVCHKLTISSTAQYGIVRPGGGTQCLGPGYYVEGSKVQLYAYAAPPLIFTNWSGDLTGSVNPVEITMDKDYTITANWVTSSCYTFTTSAAPAGRGMVTAKPAANCGPDKYLSGTQVELTATPVTGYGFTSWSGGASGASNPLKITVTANLTITANFAQAPTVTSIDSSWNPASGSFILLTIHGGNFNAKSIVRWNGVDLTTTFINATTLTASVPLALVTPAQAASVTVFNAGESVTSGALPYTVNITKVYLPGVRR